MALLARLATVAEGGSYWPWDELRRRQPPEGLSQELGWLAERLSRRPDPSLPLVGTERSTCLAPTLSGLVLAKT